MIMQIQRIPSVMPGDLIFDGDKKGNPPCERWSQFVHHHPLSIITRGVDLNQLQIVSGSIHDDDFDGYCHEDFHTRIAKIEADRLVPLDFELALKVFEGELPLSLENRIRYLRERGFFTVYAGGSVLEEEDPPYYHDVLCFNFPPEKDWKLKYWSVNGKLGYVRVFFLVAPPEALMY